MGENKSTVIVWFKHDLRLADNPAFFEACARYQRVIPLYIFDKKNSVLGSAQAWWLHHSLHALKKTLKETMGLTFILRQGCPLTIILDLVKRLSINAVYWNRGYEPLVIKRDKKIKTALQEMGIDDVCSFNGSLLHEPWTIKNQHGDFYKVFTPYWKMCRQNLSLPKAKEGQYQPAAVEVYTDDINEWGLLPSSNWASQFADVWTPGEKGAQQRLSEFVTHQLNGYKTNRDFPAKQATSRLSPHLHFGEISPWCIVRAVELAKLAPHCDLASAEHFLAELGWREFCVYLLYHVPTLTHQNFNRKFDVFLWQNDQRLFTCWQKGLTGYPFIDAGMRELWATGFMHNRVRMITASFLTKGLFIDWREGADWFLDTLVDADLANNSAGWQWVAGCGADAAPYFRIFNPVLQSQKFDSQGHYIRRWLPELSSLTNDSIHAPWQSADATTIYAKTNYPRPIIDHQQARAKALSDYHKINGKHGS